MNKKIIREIFLIDFIILYINIIEILKITHHKKI